MASLLRNIHLEKRLKWHSESQFRNENYQITLNNNNERST